MGGRRGCGRGLPHAHAHTLGLDARPPDSVSAAPPPLFPMSRPAPLYHGSRVPSARLPRFDYGDGAFSVTVATRDRVPWFGRLEQGGVVLSDAGRVVWEEGGRTAELRPAVTLDAFVVMPDHVHGVLWIDGAAPPVDGSPPEDVETPRWGVLRSGALPPDHPAPRVAPPDPPAPGGPPDHPAPWRPATLGTVVNQFKGACTRRI